MMKLAILMMIILLAVTAKVVKQDFFSPAVINIYWNAFFIIGAVILFGAGIEWKYNGIFWILASCLCCLMGQVVGEKIKVSQKGYEIKEKRNYLYLILVVVILIGIIEPFLYMNAFGFSLLDLFHIDKLLELNTQIAYDRYYGHEYNPPAISSAISIIIYMGALMGGYSFHYMETKKGKVLAIATLFPILFLAIITNAKVGVIASVFLWFIGWLLKVLHVKKTGSVLTPKLVVIGICIAITGIVFLDLVMLMRIGSIDMETQLIVNQKLQEYAFGQVNSFAVWFDSINIFELEFGSNTYMFITNWLGITERKQGVYDLMPGVVSNIYTINRGVITDFGKIGGLLYWTIIGLLSGGTYKKVKSGLPNCIITMVILGTIYFTIFYGFIISPWIYSSYVLAFIGFGVFLAILKYIKFSFKR